MCTTTTLTSTVSAIESGWSSCGRITSAHKRALSRRALRASCGTRGLRSRVPVPPVAHLRFGHDGPARRAEPHVFRVELRSDPKGGVALPGYFLGGRRE